MTSMSPGPARFQTPFDRDLMIHELGHAFFLCATGKVVAAMILPDRYSY